MDSEELRRELRGDRFLPHQVELIELALREDAPSGLVLVAQAGLGAGGTLVEIASRLLTQGAARVLLLTSMNALLHQYRHRLVHRAAGMFPVERLDKELVYGRVRSGGAWPSGCYLGLLDSLRGSFFEEAVGAQSWDLVLVDSGPIGPARADRIRTVTRAARRSLLWVPATSKELEGLASSHTVTWGRHLRDWEGNPILSERKLELVEYGRSASERAALEALVEALKQLRDDGPARQMRESLLRAALSSPYALESSLRTRIAALEGRWGAGASDSCSEGSEPETSDSQGELLPAISDLPDALMGGLRAALRMQRIVEADSKKESILSLVRSLLAGGHTHISLVASRGQTIAYLGLCLEDAGISSHEVSGNMPEHDRGKAYHEFAGEGGVLLLTDAMLRSAPMLPSRAVIHADLPWSESVFQQRWGAAAVRGPGPVTAYLFSDTTAPGAELERVLIGLARAAM